MTWLYALGVVTCLIWAAVIMTWPQHRPGPRLQIIHGGKVTRQRRRAMARRDAWSKMRQPVGKTATRTGRYLRRMFASGLAKAMVEANVH